MIEELRYIILDWLLSAAMSVCPKHGSGLLGYHMESYYRHRINDELKGDEV